MPAVDSSMMTWVEYSKTAQELDITFGSGKTYTYFDVPPQVYTALMASGSKGTYFREHIDGAYSYGLRKGRKRSGR